MHDTNLGEMLLEGLEEAVAHAEGRKTKARERVVMVDMPEPTDPSPARR